MTSRPRGGRRPGRAHDRRPAPSEGSFRARRVRERFCRLVRGRRGLREKLGGCQCLPPGRSSETCFERGSSRSRSRPPRGASASPHARTPLASPRTATRAAQTPPDTPARTRVDPRVRDEPPRAPPPLGLQRNPPAPPHESRIPPTPPDANDPTPLPPHPRAPLQRSSRARKRPPRARSAASRPPPRPPRVLARSARSSLPPPTSARLVT